MIGDKTMFGKIYVWIKSIFGENLMLGKIKKKSKIYIWGKSVRLT